MDMSTKAPIDAGRLALMLAELRLPTIARAWPGLAETANREGWPAARFLAALVEHELADRARRRIERHLAAAKLPPGKTLDAFDFATVPMLSRAHVSALAANDGWLEKGSHILCFGPPGCGKSHLPETVTAPPLPAPGFPPRRWRATRGPLHPRRE
jgi:DNA replication protein DnaC